MTKVLSRTTITEECKDSKEIQEKVFAKEKQGIPVHIIVYTHI